MDFAESGGSHGDALGMAHLNPQKWPLGSVNENSRKLSSSNHKPIMGVTGTYLSDAKKC